MLEFQGAGERRQILVAVDGSVHSADALDWALRNVVHFKSDVLFLLAVARRHSEVTTVRLESQGRAQCQSFWTRLEAESDSAPV